MHLILTDLVKVILFSPQSTSQATSLACSNPSIYRVEGFLLQGASTVFSLVTCPRHELAVFSLISFGDLPAAFSQLAWLTHSHPFGSQKILLASFLGLRLLQLAFPVILLILAQAYL